MNWVEPAGIGAPRARLLRPGDAVEVSIEGIGTLTTTMAAACTRAADPTRQGTRDDRG